VFAAFFVVSTSGLLELSSKADAISF